MTKLTIKDFWEFHNSNCWKIKRKGLVDMYLYLPTMRYIYKTPFKDWRGTKNPYPVITLSDEERAKIKKFETEDDAVRWMCKSK